MGKKLRERKAQEESSNWKLRAGKSFLWKIFRFCFKSLYIIAFIFYLMLGTTMSYGWAKTKWVRHFPPEYIETVARVNLLGKQTDPEKVREWFLMREMKDCRLIMEKLTPYTPHLSSTTFFLFTSCASQEGNVDEALNWRQYARFRARFDALRCGSNDAPENFNDMIDMTSRDDIQALLRKDPSLQYKSIRWVLDHDAEFPRPDNDPVDICRQLASMERGNFQIVDRKEWPGIHETLRMMSAYFADRIEENIAHGGQGNIDMPNLRVPRKEIKEELDKAFDALKVENNKKRAEENEKKKKGE